MIPEQAERLLIEELFKGTIKSGKIPKQELQEIDKLTGDASTRKYYRIFTDLEKYVVCLDNPQEKQFGPHPFIDVQKLLQGNNIRVPLIFDTNLEKGYLLEEDLGDETILSLISSVRDTNEERKIYERILDELLVFQRISQDNLEAVKKIPLSFDLEKYQQEMNFTYSFFIERFLEIRDPLVIKNLDKEIQPILKRLANEKKVFCHRDFHSRNIMCKKNEYIYIDFQDARWGIPQYDLVSLLEDCYFDLHEENRLNLKKKFFEKNLFVQENQGSYEKFDSLYNDMLIQRVFKAIGSFCFIYYSRKDHRYLKYIGFAMEKIRKTLDKDPRYLQLKDVLCKAYYGS